MADVLVVADAALGRAAAEVVLDAVAGEDLDGAVVHLHREVDGELAPGLPQDLAQAGVEVEPLGGEVELLLGHVPRVDGRQRPARWSSVQASFAGRPATAAAGSRFVSRTTPRGAAVRADARRTTRSEGVCRRVALRRGPDSPTLPDQYGSSIRPSAHR